MSKWDTLWLGANIATMATSHDDDLHIIEDAAIGIKDGKIIFIDKMTTLPGDPNTLADTCYVVKDKWITPGLIDCHTHLIFAGNRANEFSMRIGGASYAQIAQQGGGILSTVYATRAASEKTLFELSKNRLQHWLEQGVTTVEIKSGYGLNLETELKMLRVAKRLQKEMPITIKVTCLAAHTVPPEYQHDKTAYIDLVVNEILPAAKAENLCDAVDVFCEHIAFDLTQTERIFKKAQALGLPIKCHAEQLSCSHSAELSARFDALSCEHLEFVSSAGIQAMAQHGCVAVLLPMAYYFLNETQMPPIGELQRQGVKIAIATDCNPGSAPTFSLLTTLQMASVLWKMTPNQVLKGVTKYAAKALGIDHLVGSLAVGKLADFAIWDIQTPSELCYWIGHKPLYQLIKAGKIIITR